MARRLGGTLERMAASGAELPAVNRSTYLNSCDERVRGVETTGALAEAGLRLAPTSLGHGYLSSAGHVVSRKRPGHAERPIS